MSTETIAQRAERLVRQEVHYCVSSLVSTLAQGHAQSMMSRNADLDSMFEQAMELCSPLLDYEEAAREAGWSGKPGSFRRRDLAAIYTAETWQELCDLEGIEPHEREVFEHWIVSDWLADKLAEKGEKVDKDFAGMTVWARTTTGQAIHGDSVIERIAAELS